MKKVIINRFVVGDMYSLGHCYIQDSKNNIVEYVGVSLERGWMNNKKGMSSVPEGTYKLKLEYSPRFKKDLWELYGVPGRSECKFHVANYWHELNGCIALGRKHVDLDRDTIPDITSSRIVMSEFHKLLQRERNVQIKIKNVTF